MRFFMSRAASVTCSLMFLAAGAAHAQQSQPTASSSEISLTSQAPRKDSPQSEQVEEITVTAQRRSEREQDVPISVSEVSGAMIADVGIVDVTSIKDVVPGVNVRASAGFNTPYMRGVGSSNKGPLVESPVAIYVDDVYYGSEANILSFNNIQSLEAIKGPQGTLFGRNASGGVLNIKTLDPGSETTGSFHIGYGNYQSSSGDAYISGRITDDLAANLAVIGSTQGQGFGRDLSTGEDVYRNNYNYAVRSKAIFTPDADTRVVFIGDYSSEKNSLSSANSFAPGTYYSPGVPVPVISSNPYDVENHLQPVVQSQAGGGSIAISHDFGSAFALKSMTAYRSTSYQQDLDLDLAPPLEWLTEYVIEEQATQEFQVQSLGDGPFSWTTGIFYFHDRSAMNPETIYFATGGLANILYNQVFYADSIAGYAQGTYAVTPDTKLTVGARDTYEKRSVSGYEQEDFARGSSILAHPGDVTRDLTADKPTFRLSLDHEFKPDVMMYASVNTGFKSGGFSNVTVPAFLPETLTAYEVGLKSEIFDRRASLNFAGFYYDYRNIQVQQITPVGSFVTNGAKAKIYGLDADLHAKLTSSLSLVSGLELLQAKYATFDNVSIGTPEGGDGTTVGSASGNYLPYAPHVAANIGLVHNVSVGGGTLTSTLLTYISSRYYAGPDNFASQKSYANLNGSVRWVATSGLSLKLWADNITNNLIMYNTSDAAPTGQHLITYEPPRTFGITLGYEF